VKGNARGLIGGGIAVSSFGATLLAIAAATGVLHDVGLVASIGTTIAAGTGMFAASALRLPRWARLRQRQMDDIAARVITQHPSSGAN
jgi:hypothetical protein